MCVNMGCVMSVLDWNQKDKVELRDWLRGLLRSEVVDIVFEKKDGTERTMKCTLKEDTVVPYEAKTEWKKVVSEENLAVWDVEKGGWRSFRLDSIKEIKWVVS